MDREQEEMQFLGLFGIYVEAYKLIFRLRKIFSQITLSLILPLSFIYLAHLEISHQLNSKIWHNEFRLENTQSGTQQSRRLNHLISTEFAILCIFKVLYFTVFLVFSLLSTAAVVYAVACVYTGREITFPKIMSVVPKVWKRLMVTFLCAFLAFFAFNLISIFTLIILTVVIGDTVAGAVLLIVLLIAYVAAFVYMTVIWHLASVVSVLEDSYGIRAMRKSQGLIRGKTAIAVIIFFKLNLGMAAIQLLFDLYVVHGRRRSFGVLPRIGFGILCFLLLFKMILFGLVIQTIVYFVCKSYHHENIDKSALADHLEVYLGDYVPLKSKDVQLEEYEA